MFLYAESFANDSSFSFIENKVKYINLRVVHLSQKQDILIPFFVSIPRMLRKVSCVLAVNVFRITVEFLNC